MTVASIDAIHIELFDKFQQGGIIMWPMFLMSLAALAIFIERVLFLHRNQIRSREFLSGIENSLEKGRLIEALTVCQDTPGPAAAMVKAGLMAFRKSDEEVRESVREAAMVELGPIKRRVGALSAIAQSAPIFGLLGTVIGLIDAFSQYEQQGVYLNAGTEISVASTKSFLGQYVASSYHHRNWTGFGRRVFIGAPFFGEQGASCHSRDGMAG